MQIKEGVAILALMLCNFSETVFSQECNDIDGLSSASGKFTITKGEACESSATLDYSYRYNNGTLTIEWGTSSNYGNQKSVYESNPIRLEGLEPNTTYLYTIWGNWRGQDYQYGQSSFSTSGPPPNESPTITSDNAVSCTTGTSITYTISAEDPDGDNVTFSANALPDWITLDGETLTLNSTTESSDIEVKIIATDGKEGADTLNLAVTVVQVVGVRTRQNAKQPVTLTLGKTRLNFPAMYGKPLNVALYSLDGSMIMQRLLKVEKGMITGGLLPDEIVPGIYIVKVRSFAGAGSYTIGIHE